MTKFEEEKRLRELEDTELRKKNDKKKGMKLSRDFNKYETVFHKEQA